MLLLIIWTRVDDRQGIKSYWPWLCTWRINGSILNYLKIKNLPTKTWCKHTWSFFVFCWSRKLFIWCFGYCFCNLKAMAGSGSSMLYSFLMFIVILSLQQMYRGKLASTELFTILGGFISSLLFLVSLTVIWFLQSVGFGSSSYPQRREKDM